MKNTELLTQMAGQKVAIKQQNQQNYQNVYQQLIQEAQYNASMAENKRQFDENMKFQREQFNWQKAKAAASGGGSSGGRGSGSSGGLCGSGFLALLALGSVGQGVHSLDDQEDNDGHDEEVDDGHNQSAVVERHFVDGEMQSAEILLKDNTNQRRNQVGNQSVYDGFKSGADHNTDGHIDYIATVNKLSKLS